MTQLLGKNTLNALDVPLNELYVLRRSGSNTRPLAEVDQYLANRPDYIIYRLLRERQPRNILTLLNGIGSGKELLLESLKHAANSPNLDIKWTAYGLVALGMLRIAESEDTLHYVRMPQKLTSHEIPIGDRIDNSDLQKILKWMKDRQRKFKKAIAGVRPSNPLRANRNQKLAREHLICTEQFLLLALGQISIYLVETVLKQDTEALASETLHDVEYFLSGANGRWRPEQGVFVDNLRHYRIGYWKNRFSSCYLPFDLYDYGEWLAAAFGRLAKATEKFDFVSDYYRLLLSFSGVQHRERLFRQKKASKEEGHKLMIALDYTFGYAKRAQRMAIMGALAARYLAIGNILGWTKKDYYDKKRFERAHELKPIALISGCLIEGEVAQLDCSELSKGSDTLELDEQSEYYLDLYRKVPRSKPEADVAISILDKSDETVPDDADLSEVASALGWRFKPGELNRRRIDVLKTAIICLTPGKGQNPEDRAKLLDVHTHAFMVFVKASLVSGVAALAEQLQINGRLSNSVFSDAVNVTKFAGLLLYWLERPYMADMEIRANWQRQLRAVYAALDKKQRERLSLDDKLLIFAAVSHVTAAAMRSLGETEADLIEQTIYEEWSESDIPIRGARAKSKLAVRADQLSEILEQQEIRGRRRTAFVQIVLSPDAKLATILVAMRVRNKVVSQEADINFVPEIHQEVQYVSWNDISTEVVEYDYFNNETQQLHKHSVSPLGQRSVRELWQQIIEILRKIGAIDLPEHIWIAPDGGLANIPWQLVAMNEALHPDEFPIVTLVHGLRWIYLSAHESEVGTHEPEESVEPQRFHDRGIQAWISKAPTPRPDLEYSQRCQSRVFWCR